MYNRLSIKLYPREHKLRTATPDWETWTRPHSVCCVASWYFRQSVSDITDAVLKIYNDLLLAADIGDVSAHCLLDLTAAFDTVDHHITSRKQTQASVASSISEKYDWNDYVIYIILQWSDDAQTGVPVRWTSVFALSFWIGSGHISAAEPIESSTAARHHILF